MSIRRGKKAYHPFQYFWRMIKVLFLGMIVLSSIFAINQFKSSRYFPIKTVKVYGVNHVDEHEAQDLLEPLVSHGFFNVNIEYIRDRMLQFPWVSDIFVRRTWPDQLEITIVEKRALASWNNETLLSEGGEIFSPKFDTFPNHLAAFVGPEGKQIIMLQYFNQMNRLLAPLHAKISYLELTPYFSWKMKLDNGITLQIGHKDILTRLDHFVKVYPKIVGDRALDVDYIDLRYPNGMAVKWKVDS